MSLWALIAASISISSKTYGQILAGRIINYMYTVSYPALCRSQALKPVQGMELSVIPVFQAELMPAPIRGFAVGSYQMSIVSLACVVEIARLTSTRLWDNS